MTGDMEIGAVNFALIYSGAYYELVDANTPMKPGSCIRVPCPSFMDFTVIREEASAAEATEASYTCHMP